MEYSILIKEEYDDRYQRVACGDLKAAQRELMLALKEGKDPVLVAEIPYNINIKIQEDKIGEVKKDKAQLDKGTGAESNGAVRRGDKGAAKEVDRPGGDAGAGNSAGD